MDTRKARWNSRSVALAAVLAALYSTYVIYFAVTSFGPLQVRVVDALLPLSILFGLPAIVGVTIGGFIGNLIGSPFGLVDYAGGPTANFIAATLAWAITRRKFKGAWLSAIVVQIASVTLVVGSYLVVLASPPEVPLWVGWIEFLGSEIAAIGVLGYPLLKAVDRATRRNVPSVQPKDV